MIRRMLVTVVGLMTVALTSNVFAGEGQGAFHPASFSDTPYIQTNAYVVYSIDTTSPRAVTVSLGRYAPGTRTFTFYGNGEGNTGTFTCSVIGVAEPGQGSAFAQQSTSSTGAFSLAVPITLGGTATWNVSAICTFPRSFPNSIQIYGWN